LNLFAFFVIASTVLAGPRQAVLFKGMAEVIEIPWKQSLTFGEARPFIPHPITTVREVIIIRNGKKVRQIRLRELNPENESFELLPGDEITFLVKQYKSRGS
jgi:hypothetical protein